jgi:uncharacterized membrane protein
MTGKIYILLLFLIIMAGCNSEAQTNPVSQDDGTIKIPLSEITTEVQFYTYDDNGVNIRYFAVLGSDGKPRTAFDACDVCGGYKGYSQVGNDITCNNCGSVFSIDEIGTKNTGYGCWPSYLPHSIEGDNLLIRVSDLKESRSKFV